METQIKNRAMLAIKESVFPGCVIGLIKKNGERIVVPCGNFTFETNSKEIKQDSIFDVASITKSIPVSSLALKLIDEGKLKLEDKLINFLPEFKNSQRESVLIKHLLTQTLDYSFRLSSHKDKSAEEILNIILTSELKTKPGEKFFYSNATTIILGLVIEKITGKTLDILAEEIFFKPLKMTRTSFNPLLKFKKEEIVPTEIQEWRGGLIHGEIHDESAYILSKNKPVGSAGIFSTVPDLLNFLEMLLNNGTLNGKHYFSQEITKSFHTNQLSHINEWSGLGWELNQPQYMGTNNTNSTFGKTGFTGCVVTCDIQKGIGIVILSNYTYPKRKPDTEKLNKFRKDISEIINKTYE